MTMRRPRRLRPGSRIAVVAPASPFSREELERGLQELRDLGFDPVVDPRTFERQRYVAGSARTRAAALTEALEDPAIGAIIGARGGYGSVQVLPFLDPATIVAAAKPIIGYSDLTSLLQFVTLDCGLVSFHGPTVAGRLSGGEASYDRRTLLGALTSAAPLGELRPGSLAVVAPGDAAGVLLGGNLTQICASLGTPFAFSPPPGFVFFIDEVNERPYRIDRLLTQVRLAGVLERAAAIVFGELPGCDEPGGDLLAIDVVSECLADFPGPILWGFPSGHTRGAAWTLPLGVRCRVVAEPGAPACVVEEAAVE